MSSLCVLPVQLEDTLCQRECCAAQDEEESTNLRDKVLSRVLDQLPAAKASAVKVTVGVPDLQLERATDFHEVSQDGIVTVQRKVDLQLGALQAAVELRVRCRVHTSEST